MKIFLVAENFSEVADEIVLILEKFLGFVNIVERIFGNSK